MSGYEQVSVTSPENTTDPKTLTATCPAGKKVLSGGWTSTVFFSFAGESLPSANNEWTVTAFVDSGATSWALTVFAICATVT